MTSLSGHDKEVPGGQRPPSGRTDVTHIISNTRTLSSVRRNLLTKGLDRRLRGLLPVITGNLFSTKRSLHENTVTEGVNLPLHCPVPLTHTRSSVVSEPECRRSSLREVESRNRVPLSKSGKSSRLKRTLVIVRRTHPLKSREDDDHCPTIG